jgi:hypothetical protein
VDWQPIKTAPAGERVLVANERGTVFVAKLLVLRWYDDAERLIDRPEWWTPLPAAPSEEQPAAPKSRGRKPSR